jgi:CBS domain-containing protein
MKVSDILRVKGNTLFTITPDDQLAEAANTMAEKDIGSLVVMEHGVNNSLMLALRTIFS